MKIVILDGYTLNPGDLSWDWLNAIGEVTVLDRTAIDDIAARARGAEIIITNKAPLDAATLHQLPSLKFIGVTATGYNIVDTATARAKGIVVSNVPAYGTASVVQMTFALLLELCLHVQKHSDSVFAGKWTRSPDFSYSNFPLVELQGKIMGIIGYGTIGRQVGAVATAFGMKILAMGRSGPKEEVKSSAGKDRIVWDDPAPRDDFQRVGLEELLRQSDVVSIHCPLTPETKGMINKERLEWMKPSAFLINTSRGPVIVEEDLTDALNGDVIAGAGLDVLTLEPPRNGNPLLAAKHCLITPHIAWATREARTRLMDMTRENVVAFINGRPVNVVNP